MVIRWKCQQTARQTQWLNKWDKKDKRLFVSFLYECVRQTGRIGSGKKWGWLQVKQWITNKQKEFSTVYLWQPCVLLLARCCRCWWADIVISCFSGCCCSVLNSFLLGLGWIYPFSNWGSQLKLGHPKTWTKGVITVEHSMMYT